MHARGLMKSKPYSPMRLLIVKVVAVVERDISEPRVRGPNKEDEW